MLYFDKHYAGWRIAVWHVTEDINELLAMLPDEDLVRNEAEERFQSLGRILEWTAVRVLLFKMLERQVPIAYDDDGAPHLPEYENLDISISHTHDYVAVALSEIGKVGIDVEQIGPKVARVKSRFVREDERADNVIDMLLHWSAKETAFKVLHCTKVDFLKHFYIPPFTQQEEGNFLLHETRTDDEQTIPIAYKVFADFVLTYAHILP